MDYLCVGCGVNEVTQEEGICSDECYLDVYGNLNEED